MPESAWTLSPTHASVMVPKNSPPPSEPARELSAETLRRLREVIGERWRALETSEDHLRATLRAAASEAKRRGLRPEELIIALKALEEEVFAQR